AGFRCAGATLSRRTRRAISVSRRLRHTAPRAPAIHDYNPPVAPRHWLAAPRLTARGTARRGAAAPHLPRPQETLPEQRKTRLMDSIKRYFGFDAAGTNLRTEVLAGLTTFLTMAY